MSTRIRRPTCPTMPWPLAGEWQPPNEVEADPLPLPPPHEVHTDRSLAVTQPLPTIKDNK